MGKTLLRMHSTRRVTPSMSIRVPNANKAPEFVHIFVRHSHASFPTHTRRRKMSRSPRQADHRTRRESFMCSTGATRRALSTSLGPTALLPGAILYDRAGFASWLSTSSRRCLSTTAFGILRLCSAVKSLSASPCAKWIPWTEKQVPNKFAVALIQMACGPEPADNLSKALDRVSEAARMGADVVCLPELFQTQYFCQREETDVCDVAEPIPGGGTEVLAAAALKNDVVLIASLFEKRAPGLYHNTAANFDFDGVLRGSFRQMHTPHHP